MIDLTMFSALAAAALVQAHPADEWIGQAPLDGFVSGHRQQVRGNSIEEFVPRGESVQDWSRMVTVLRMAEVAHRATPVEYAQTFTASLPSSCPGAVIDPPQAIRVGDRQAARTWVRCPLLPATGKPEMFYMVAIAGARDMHVVQIAFRRIPGQADAAFTVGQLESIRLCTPASAETVCRR